MPNFGATPSDQISANGSTYVHGQFAQSMPTPPIGKPPAPKRNVSRRVVVLGLVGAAGIVVVGGGLSLLALSQKQYGATGLVTTSTNTPASNPTSAPTDMPTPDTNATATANANPTTATSPTATTVPTVQTTPGQVLYTANWSGGLDGWSGTGDWKTLNGALLNDGTNESAVGSAPTILVPTSLIGIPNYAVEAAIQVQSYNGYNPSFGLVVRTGAQGVGYLVGVGTNGGLNTARISDVSSNDFYNSTRSSPFDPGTKVHTYRVEIKGNDIRLLIDGGLAVELFDNRYLTGERTGLWCQGVQLTISSYKISAL